jgi:hypothetical protein
LETRNTGLHFGFYHIRPNLTDPFIYRAMSRAMMRLKGASAGGIEPHALAPAVQSSSARDILFSVASL